MLQAWVSSKQPKNLETLIETFGERSFAVVMLLFMLLPALPLPTGGVTHVLEVVVMLLALEQVIGLKSIWLPAALAKRVKLGSLLKGKTMESMLGRIKRLEAKSSPRGRWIFALPLMPRLLGLVVFGLTLTAFLSPPFSGLDTLPSLGVVLISMAILLDDAMLLLAGAVAGSFGVVLSIGFGAAIIKAFQHYVHLGL